MQYRRTPTSSGYSPSELLNSRQLRTKLDTLLPSPAHAAQGKQAKEAAKSQREETVAKVVRSYNVGDAVYALYYGPRRNNQPRWVPAIITKRKGTRTMNVRVYPRGPTWCRHIEQLQPRYATDEDTEPGATPGMHDPTPKPEPTSPGHAVPSTTDVDTPQPDPDPILQKKRAQRPPNLGHGALRRSKRSIKPPDRFSPTW